MLLLEAFWERCYYLRVQNSSLLLTAGTTDAYTTCMHRCIELSSNCLINRINYSLLQTFHLTNEVIIFFFLFDKCVICPTKLLYVLFLVKLH